jgi:hypothetical protein
MEKFLPPVQRSENSFSVGFGNADYRDAGNLRWHCGQQVEGS